MLSPILRWNYLYFKSTVTICKINHRKTLYFWKYYLRYITIETNDVAIGAIVDMGVRTQGGALAPSRLVAVRK